MFSQTAFLYSLLSSHFILLGEKLTVQNIIGMTIVIAGLFMSQMNGKKKIIDEALALPEKLPDPTLLYSFTNTNFQQSAFKINQPIFDPLIQL